MLKGIILPTRPKRTAHAYSKIWTSEGSPLIATSASVKRKLCRGPRARRAGPHRHEVRASIQSGLRIGGSSIADGCTEVLLFPQYPHYAMASWETVVARVYEEAARQAPALRISCVQPFFGDRDYIEMLHAVSAPFLSKPYDHLLFSYHRSLSATYARRTLRMRIARRVADCCTTCSPAHATCYRAQCVRTTAELARRAGLEPSKYSISFQSRLAGEPWLQPFTDSNFVRLPKAGVKRLLYLPELSGRLSGDVGRDFDDRQRDILSRWRRTF